MTGMQVTIVRVERIERETVDEPRQGGYRYRKGTAPCTGCETAIKQAARRVTVCGGCGAGNQR